MFIACPSCKSKFKAKPAVLGKTIPCPKCGEEFEATAKRERVAKEGFNPVAISLVLLAFLVVAIGVMMNSGDDKPVEPTKRAVIDDDAPLPVKKVETSPDAELIDRATKLVAAMRDESDADLPRWIDFVQAHAHLAGKDGRAWTTLTDLDRFEFKESFVKRLCGEGEDREFAKAAVAKGLTIGSRGTSTVEIVGVLENPLKSQTRTMKMTLRPHDSVASWQLVAFEVGPIDTIGGKTLGREEPVASTDSARVPKPRGPSLPDPATVEPLADTTSLMNDAIQSAMRDLQSAESTVAGARARTALVEAGKHAVPHLLNAMVSIDLADPAQTLVAARIANTLIDITGVDYPIVPGGNAGSMLGEGAEENDSNRRRWYAWWRDHGKAFCEHGRKPSNDPDDPEEEDG